MSVKYVGYNKNVLDLSSLQVVVLMGGLGSRLGEYTEHTPKPLIAINKKPFFEYEFKLLLHAGFRKFVFLTGYHADMVDGYFGDGSKFGQDIHISYSYDGGELLGTAGAVVNALELLEDDFMLIYADSFMDIDYFEVVYRYFEGKERGNNSLMTVMENHNRFDKSNTIFQEGEIAKYDKGNPSADMHYIDYGAGVFSKKIFEDFKKGCKVDLSDIQKKLVEEGSCAGCEETRRFYEIGSPTSLAEFKNYIIDRFEVPHAACFIDRDGVINEIVFNEDTEQLDSPTRMEQFRFIPQALEGLKMLSDAGYLLFIVTNQPAAAKGKAVLADLYDINTHMVKSLREYGIRIQEVAMCPHHPIGSNRTKERFLVGECVCRKPAPGLIANILKKYNINMGKAYMVGDSYTDILAGRAVGLKTVFIGDYKCDVCARLKYHKPEIYGKNLLEVAKIIGNGKENEIFSEGI